MIKKGPAMMGRLKNYMVSQLPSLARDKSGVVMIEFAYCLPVLLLAGFSSVEITNLQAANTRISQIAMLTADNVSRAKQAVPLGLPQLREVDVNDAFLGAGLQSEDIQLLKNGRIILSSLQRNAEGGQWIAWQRCKGVMQVTSLYGAQDRGKTGTAFTGMGPADARIIAEAGTGVIVAEVTYQYQPFISGSLLGAITLREESAFYVRDDRDLTRLYNPIPQAEIISTCNLFTET